MPITGTFEADFSQFLEETQKASRGLSGFSILADDTAKSMTGLEKATTTSGQQIATLSQSYHQFDGILKSVGVNISPQISALEELGTAAMSTGAEIGLLGQAGLAIGVAMAAWEIGKWIGHITGMDEALDEWVTHLAGAQTAVEQMAESAAAALSHQQEMMFEAAAIAGKSTGNLEEAEKALAKFYAQQKKDAEDAVAATKKHIDAIGQVNEALKTHAQILRDVSPAEQAVIKSTLEHGVAQGLLAESTGKTALQIRTIAQDLATEKKAMGEAKAATQEYDAAVMISYNNKITMMGQLEKASQGHFGIEGQIEQLHQLAVAEDEATVAALARLTSEKDRLKVREGNEKRQQEIEIETAKLEQQLADQKGASMARGLAMQKELNQAQGLDAQGAILLPQDAMTEYQKKVDSINATMDDGIEKTAALAQANKQLADSYTQAAAAADGLGASKARAAVTDAQRAQAVKEAGPGATEGQIAAALARITGGAAPSNIVGAGLYPGSSTPATGGSSASQTAAMRAGASFGGGTFGAGGGYTDPFVQAYMSQGYTLNEALMIATGQGAHIIGRSSAQLASLGYRASGGPVSAGSGYIVGERGPELFTPNVSGTITPGGGGISIVIQGSVLSTQAELAALVEQAIVAAYRRGGNRLPV